MGWTVVTVNQAQTAWGMTRWDTQDMLPHMGQHNMNLVLNLSIPRSEASRRITTGLQSPLAYTHTYRLNKACADYLKLMIFCGTEPMCKTKSPKLSGLMMLTLGHKTCPPPSYSILQHMPCSSHSQDNEHPQKTCSTMRCSPWNATWIQDSQRIINRSGGTVHPAD